MKVCPAIVRVPEREALPVLEATLYITVPLPEPLAPDVTVIQLALLVAVQAHPDPADTVMFVVPPLAANEPLVGVIE